MTATSAPAKTFRQYLVDFWQFIKPYRRPLRDVYVLHFLNALLNLIPALSVRFYIDAVLAGKDSTVLGMTLHALPPETPVATKVWVSLVFLSAMVLLIIAANTIGVIMWRMGTRSVQKVILDIKVAILNHINKLHLGYFSNERVGTVMTKAVGDVDNTTQLLQNSFLLTYQMVQLVLAPFLMLAQSPVLTLIVFLPTPLIFIAYYNIRLKLKPMYKEQRETAEVINSRIQENISGIREIKAFNMEDQSQEEYSKVNWKYYDLANRIMRVFSINHQLQYGSRDLGTIFIAVLGGILLLHGTGGISVGLIASFIALAGYVYNPVASLMGYYDTFQRGMVSVERIIDFLHVERDVQDRKNAVDLRADAVRGDVEYRGVSFSYVRGTPVLRGVDFAAKSGERIAVVGPSGSGKSTLLSLLLRFYNPDSGAVSIDGHDIREFTQTSVRAGIGVVFQETFLFYGTIRDNFRFIDPDVTEEEIAAACRSADILDTITGFPQGFDTVVGERGMRLSGGQKQRIAIARVFLKNPRIVILDEATNAVDTITESQIQRSIEKMLQGRTAFIIAHRLSTIKNCSRIIVLDNGTIAETGTHEELLALGGMYRELHRRNEFLTE